LTELQKWGRIKISYPHFGGNAIPAKFPLYYDEIIIGKANLKT
jgi:hypothetical protein